VLLTLQPQPPTQPRPVLQPRPVNLPAKSIPAKVNLPAKSIPASATPSGTQTVKPNYFELLNEQKRRDVAAGSRR